MPQAPPRRAAREETKARRRARARLRASPTPTPRLRLRRPILSGPTTVLLHQRSSSRRLRCNRSGAGGFQGRSFVAAAARQRERVLIGRFELDRDALALAAVFCLEDAEMQMRPAGKSSVA